MSTALVQILDDNLSVPIAVRVEMSERPVVIYLLSLSPSSRRTVLGALSTIAKIVRQNENLTFNDVFDVPWEELEYREMLLIQNALLQRISPASTVTYMIYLRNVLKTAWKLGHFDFDTLMRRTAMPSISLPQTDRSKGTFISPYLFEELLSIVETFHDQKRLRYRLIFHLGYFAGLRRREMVLLRLNEIQWDAKPSLRLTSTKRNKLRIIPIAQPLRTSLNEWLSYRGSAEGYLLRSKEEKLEDPFRDQMIYDMIREVTSIYNSTTDQKISLSPHDLRHSFATRLFQANVDVFIVKRLMGHSDISTTALYDARSDEALVDAMKVFDFE